MSYSTKLQGGTDEQDIGNIEDGLKTVPSQVAQVNWDVLFDLMKQQNRILKKIEMHLSFITDQEIFKPEAEE
jgi:hypothetical protein